MIFWKPLNTVPTCWKGAKWFQCLNHLQLKSRHGRNVEAIRAFAYDLGLTLKKWCKIYYEHLIFSQFY